MASKKRSVQRLEDEVIRNGNEIDNLDMNIINELLNDSDMSSTDISRKYSRPLSTIQRRRTRLERTIIQKDYSINANYANWRSGEIFLTVDKGRTKEVGKMMFDKYATNLTQITTTLNNVGTMICHIYFRSSPQMFSLVEELKKMESVRDVMYAEHIEVLGTRKPRFILEDFRKNE